MSKLFSPSFVAVVVFLPMILLSPESSAQPTVDEAESCRSRSSTLEKVTMDVSRDLKALRSENAEMKKLLVLSVDGSNPFNAAGPTKQALVTALTSNCIPLLIQQNVDGSGFFNRSWAEFKVGFNDTKGNFWLGNDLLSELTLNGRYQLKFDLQSRANPSYWYSAQYSAFVVFDERTNYTLRVGGYSGNAGDELSLHNGMMFTTYDRDNDLQPENCAAISGGGFWYGNEYDPTCAFCGVNNKRGSPEDFRWYGLPVPNPDLMCPGPDPGPDDALLQSSRMWLQCK